MFRAESLFTEPNINFVLNHAALGDLLSSLPAIAWARKHQPANVNFNVWLPEHMLPLVVHLFNYVPGGDLIRCLPLHTFQQRIKDTDNKEFYDTIVGPAVMNSLHLGQATRNRMDMVDFAFMTLVDRMPVTPNERNYLHKAPLGPAPIGTDPYIVIPVNGTSLNKTPSARWIEGMIRWCHDNGYRAIISGKKDTIVRVFNQPGGASIPVEVTTKYDTLPEDVKAMAVDARDTLTLLEARDLCGHAAAVIGYDGGTLHLAGTTDVPIVYGCTTLNPHGRPIYRDDQKNKNVRHVTPRDLKCAGCATNWTLLFGHDFRHCGYGDNLCVDRMEPEDFINALSDLGVGTKSFNA